MSKAPLKIVPAASNLAARVKNLQAEARTLARGHVADLVEAMGEVQRLASEVATGGDAYPPGVRDLARRMAEDIEARGHTLAALNNREGCGRG